MENAAIDVIDVVLLGKRGRNCRCCDWMRQPSGRFLTVQRKDWLKGFDILNGHTWYAFYFSNLARDTTFPVIDTDRDGLNRPACSDT